MDPFEEEKRASLAQVLMKCARLVNERALPRVQVPEGAPQPRPAHTALFPHVSFEGTRLKDLARSVGISKQAVGQLVDDLEEMGIMERIPDPEDGRAKRIRWTDKGHRTILVGLQVLGTVEDEIRELLGAKRTKALHRTLLELHDWLEEQG